VLAEVHAGADRGGEFDIVVDDQRRAMAPAQVGERPGLVQPALSRCGLVALLQHDGAAAQDRARGRDQVRPRAIADGVQTAGRQAGAIDSRHAANFSARAARRPRLDFSAGRERVR